MRSRLFKPADVLIVLLVLGAGIVTLPWLWTGTGKTAVILVNGQKKMRLQLEGETRQASVEGVLGKVVVEWGESGVRIVHAPCPRQLCVQSHWTFRRGHRLMCVPSHLEINIEGKADTHFLDAITF